MYADQRYVSRSPRSLSLGGSIAASGLLIAGLMSFVPNVIGKKPSESIKIFTPDPAPPPPPERVKPVESPPLARQPDIYFPQPPIPQPQQPIMTGTNILPEILPPPTIPVVPGPVVIAEPPVALPPLIGAQQDSRYARDYQPEYPAQELRAQRDGTVSVRVLIGTDGRVKAIEQLSATSVAFYEATRKQALAKWRFKPATRGGVPQESWKTMSVRFLLENA